MLKLKLSSTLLLSCLVLSSVADMVFAKPHSKQTLQEFIELAMTNNPDLQADKQAYQAAIPLISASRALPDPMISAQVRNVGFIELSIGEEPMSGSGVMFQQNYPNPSKLDLKAQIARQEVFLMGERLALTRRTLRKSVQDLYLKQIYYQQALRIEQEMQKVLQTVQKTLLAYYKVGKIPQRDVWRVKREQSRLEQSQQEWSRQASVEAQRFRGVLGWPEPGIFVAENLPPKYPIRSLEVPLTWDVKAHPKWKMQNHQTVIAKLKHKLAKSALQPDYMLAGGVTQRATLEPLWEIRGGMTLPIYAQQKQIPQIKAAKKAQAREERLLEFAVQKLEQSWEISLADLKNYREQIKIIENQLIPETQFHLDASLAAYVSRPREFETLMQSVTDLLRYRQQALLYRLKVLLAQNKIEYLSGIYTP